MDKLKAQLKLLAKDNWISIVALAVLLLVVFISSPKIHPDYKIQEFDPARCLEAVKDQKTGKLSLPRQDAIDDCLSKKHDSSDLAAQWYAAQAAEDNVRIAQSQRYLSVVEAIGLLLTFSVAVWAAKEAHRAANYAQQSVAATEETGRDQARAYLNVEYIEILWVTPTTAITPKIRYSVKNTGQTPAKWFEIRQAAWGVAISENGEMDNRVFEPEILDNSEVYRYNSLGSMGAASFEWTPETDQKSLKPLFNSRAYALGVMGTIRYETFFGEIFESQFWFYSREPVTFNDETVLVNSEAVKREVPTRLKQYPASLVTYNAVMANRSQP